MPSPGDSLSMTNEVDSRRLSRKVLHESNRRHRGHRFHCTEDIDSIVVANVDDTIVVEIHQMSSNVLELLPRSCPNTYVMEGVAIK